MVQSYLALDLSKTSTGWALWSDDTERPVCGHWNLGCSLTPLGMVCLRLHQRMNELYSVAPFQACWYEKPLGGQAQKNDHQLAIAHGLAAHALSFCEAKAVRKVAEANISHWRRFWLQGIPPEKRSNDLKRMAIERCRMIGVRTANDDEADAVGILSYGLDLAGIQTPWRDAHLFGLGSAA